jgi:putative spermidine/putrescine transport system permease protein
MTGAAHWSDGLWRRPGLLLALLLGPPALWLGIIYLGSLFTLIAKSFFGIDEFTGQTTSDLTVRNYLELLQPQHLDIFLRTIVMAVLVTIASVIIAFPIAYYAARFAKGRVKALFYLAVTLPLWSSYLVKVYAWKLMLAEEGIIGWLADLLWLRGLLEWWLALPVVGGNSLSVSYTGTFLVFVYAWLPFMILPIQAALERVPPSLIEAAGDLGASPGQAFRTVLWPLALPGVVAGAIFTFSLTLGDYIIPQIIGTSARFIGSATYDYQLRANNEPLAAAFIVVPIIVMVAFLLIARRRGAFDAI